MHAVFQSSPPIPCPAPFNMAQYVLAKASDNPDKCALKIVGLNASQDWTYAQLEAAILGTAKGLQNLGLKRGSKILMRLGNTPDFPILFLAALAVDMVPVPTSAQLTQPEISKIAQELSPDLIVADTGVSIPDAPTCDVLSLASLQQFQTLLAADYVLGDPDRLGYIIYTSGTSGKPRAVMHAHRAIWARRMMWDGWYGLTENDRMLHAGAFNWTYTLGTGLMDPWSIGACAVIPADGIQSADLPTLINRYKATIFAAAPGVYRQILKHPELPAMPSLRHGLSAGENLASAVDQAWQQITNTKIFEAYGMSECSTFISGSPNRGAGDTASGYPQNGRRVGVVDANGVPVAFDQAGILAIDQNDSGLMLGYLGAAAETAARFKNGWFLTGDTCEMARGGAITYLGRDDDMMNAGGYRVSPIEVESALTTHPDITEVAATEVTVKADTTVIAAFYTAVRPLDDAALLQYASDRLARYKTPRLFIHIPELPKGANGKILRQKLRHNFKVYP